MDARVSRVENIVALLGWFTVSLAPESTTTLITDSTALGEALPPHFQFSTKAQTAETDKLRTAFVAHMPNVVGNFGLGKSDFGQSPLG